MCVTKAMKRRVARFPEEAEVYGGRIRNLYSEEAWMYEDCADNDRVGEEEPNEDI